MTWGLFLSLLGAFALGRISKLKWYIGYDQVKYDNADIGIKLRR